MLIFWMYLVTALITALPVIWLMLGAWMGVPVVLTEYLSLCGSVFVFAAAYISLSFRRAASISLLIGVIGICSFWVIEPVRAMRHTVLSVFDLVLLIAVLLVCAASARFAVLDLRGNSPKMVSRRLRIVVFSISGVFFVLIIGALGWQHKVSERRPSYYFISDDYVGWVKIHFDVPGVPATPIRTGAYQFRIPNTGEYFTSSKQESGWAHDRYFYVNGSGLQREILETGWGAGGMIWSDSSGTFEQEGKTPDHIEQFFVGTEAQLHQLGEKMGGMEPGNLTVPNTGKK